MDVSEAELDPAIAPPPDVAAEPDGYVVVLGSNDRIHFLDWGGPRGPNRPDRAGVLLIHGLSNTAWSWAPVARRIRSLGPVVAMDLRGHGLSDAPTDGYEPETLADDVVAVAEGAGLLADSDDRIVLAGHGFGAMVAAWSAALLGERCAGLVLVDGGWEDLATSTGQDPDEFLRGLDEPPEVLRSLVAFLADRKAFDPSTWDHDQERAARATVIETHAGHVVPAIRPHARARSVEAMFAYRPAVVLPSVEAPIVALAAADDESGTGTAALAFAQGAVVAAGRAPLHVTRFGGDGHNLMRYRPAEVAAAIIGVTPVASS